MDTVTQNLIMSLEKALSDELKVGLTNGPLTRSARQALYDHLSKPTQWIVTGEQKPGRGQLIVKRWNIGTVWAGRYSGSSEDVAFQHWYPVQNHPDDN